MSLEKIFSVLERGGIALIRLDVAYALICMDQKAVQKIQRMKQRSSDKQCVVLGTPKIFEEITGKKIQSTISLPVGLVAKINEKSKYIRQIPKEMIVDGKIAVFINMGALGDAIADRAFKHRKLVFGSSANITKAGNHYQLQDVENEIREQVDIEIDEGKTKYQEFANEKGLGAVILDIESGKVLRKGLLFDKVIEQAGKNGFVFTPK